MYKVIKTKNTFIAQSQIYIYMDNEETLTEEEQLALEQAEADKKAAAPRELTDEEIDALVEKRLGAKPSEFIRKTEQVKVLTEEEKKELEEKEHNESLALAIEKGWIKRKDYDSYLEMKNSDKIALARKKFIDLNPELGEDAESVFNNILRLDEDDEFESGETKVPNKEKLAARNWAIKMAEEELAEKYGKKVSELPAKRKEYIEQEAIKKVNGDLINKVVAETPRKLGYKTGDGLEYSIDISEEDIQEAQKMAVSGAISQKGLTEDEVKGTVSTYLLASSVQKLVDEGIRVGISKYAEDNERGGKGIKEGDEKVVVSEAREFLKKKGIL